MFLPGRTCVLVRGGGEMGSGVAWRLHRCGYQVIIAETDRPSAIRRWVCFSEAVFDGHKDIERVRATLCANPSDVASTLERGEIPLAVCAESSNLKTLAPNVIVDAILAKTGRTTPHGIASRVIGLGPGFVAGDDVDCVIETNRGAGLGRCIWKGSAEPNTGVPGLLGGESAKRVLRAPKDGEIEPTVEIGQLVSAGEVLVRVDGVEVRAQISGVVRGMLRAGSSVVAGVKIGDVDPRGDLEICRRISDKALAIAGGVLEGLLSDRN